jgi:hypothetical protein
MRGEVLGRKSYQWYLEVRTKLDSKMRLLVSRSSGPPKKKL